MYTAYGCWLETIEHVWNDWTSHVCNAAGAVEVRSLSRVYFDRINLETLTSTRPPGKMWSRGCHCYKFSWFLLVIASWASWNLISGAVLWFSLFFVWFDKETCRICWNFRQDQFDNLTKLGNRYYNEALVFLLFWISSLSFIVAFSLLSLWDLLIQQYWKFISSWKEWVWFQENTQVILRQGMMNIKWI